MKRYLKKYMLLLIVIFLTIIFAIFILKDYNVLKPMILNNTQVIFA